MGRLDVATISKIRIILNHFAHLLTLSMNRDQNRKTISIVAIVLHNRLEYFVSLPFSMSGAKSYSKAVDLDQIVHIANYLLNSTQFRN